MENPIYIRHLSKLISKYFKLTKIGVCLVLCSIEDEKCFSNLKILKSCQRNRLEKYLPFVVRILYSKELSLQESFRILDECCKGGQAIGHVN